MGFNSVVLVLNDHLSSIERNPKEFIKEMTYAISRAGCSGAQQEDFNPGQSTVVSCAHADQVQILAVGGNYATLMGSVLLGGEHHTEEAQVQILRNLADKHGFTLRKKPAKKAVNSGPTVKCHYQDCEERGDKVKGDEQVTCATCRRDLGLPSL